MSIFEFVDWDEVKLIGAVILAIVALMFSTVLPLAYLEGKAKAAYIKQVQGIDLTWYQAAWIDVEINNATVNLKNQ